MDQRTRIEQAKRKLDQAKTARTVAQTQKDNAEAEEQKVIAQMKERGVTPETIADKITQLNQEVEEHLEKAEKLLPGV